MTDPGSPGDSNGAFLGKGRQSEHVGRKSGRRFVLGCFGVAFLLFVVLCCYVIIGHRNAVGPYKPPPAQRP